MDYSSPTALAPDELEHVRAALIKVDGRRVLGAQLGTVVSQSLVGANLRDRFGGLKRFVTAYFPTEIVWRGRQGLDDLFDVQLGGSEATLAERGWECVAREPSPSLWTAISNPSVFVQFGYRRQDGALMQATDGVELPADLVSIQKPSREDYTTIARAFAESLPDHDPLSRERGVEKSVDGAAFNRFVREQDLLPKWEAFRIERVLGLFGERLRAAGADSEHEHFWRELLRLSQQQAWSERIRSGKLTAGKAARVATPLARPTGDRAGGPLGTKAVAIRAMEYLSEEQLGRLRLPLGSVLRAVEALREQG